MQDRALDGKLVGVGGSWVEMDGNMPNGESMIRQMLYGQREFKKMFGKCAFYKLVDEDSAVRGCLLNSQIRSAIYGLLKMNFSSPGF